MSKSPQLLAPWALFLLLGGVARADPNEYIRDLDISRGETELDVFSGSASRSRDGGPAGNAIGVGLGTGVVPFWKTELAARFSSGLGGALDEIEWENVVRLTGAEGGPLRTGILVEFERPRDSGSAWSYSVGPAIQVERPGLRWNVNALLARTQGGPTATPVHASYQIQLQFEPLARLRYGLQAMGSASYTDRQGGEVAASHRAGPALWGRLRLPGGDEELSWNAGLLLGVSRGAPDRTFRLQVEFEF